MPVDLDLARCTSRVRDDVKTLQRSERKRRSQVLLSRDEIYELNKAAREAIFPSHDSEIGLGRQQPNVIHGVVSARASTTSEYYLTNQNATFQLYHHCAAVLSATW